MKLTEQEKTRVCEHLDLINQVIRFHITSHTDITGMEYADLYQTGCLALCDAVLSYHPGRNASFETYAKVVIRNRLFDYCRHINHVQSRLLYLDAALSEHGEESFQNCLFVPSPSDTSSDGIFPVLMEIRGEYKGIAAKGIEALLLKATGYTGKDIARMYRVNPNHVAAWISRASSRLRKDNRVLEALKS